MSCLLMCGTCSPTVRLWPSLLLKHQDPCCVVYFSIFSFPPASNRRKVFFSLLFPSSRCLELHMFAAAAAAEVGVDPNSCQQTAKTQRPHPSSLLFVRGQRSDRKWGAGSRWGPVDYVNPSWRGIPGIRTELLAEDAGRVPLEPRRHVVGSF